MELNFLKHDIAVNNLIFSQSAEHSVDNEFNLPDYYPEISKILKCRVIPRVNSCCVNGQTLSVEGNVSINLIYCSPSDEIFGFEQILPFSKAFSLDNNIPEAVPECSVKCEYINCRALGERKIEVHAAIGIYAKISRRQLTGVLAEIDNPNVIVKSGRVPATSPIGSGEKSMLLEEELELGSGQPSIKNVLKYDIVPICKECKIISGKVAVKGEAAVCVLYCSAAGGVPAAYKCTLPFSAIIDVDGITEDCECSAKICLASAEIKPRTSAAGETRSFILNAKLNFTAKVTCESDLPVVLDLYSTRYNADINAKEISIEKICQPIAIQFVCKDNIKTGSDGVSSVIDSWCEVVSSDYSLQNGELCVSGNARACLLIINSTGIPEYLERPIEFSHKCQIDAVGDNLTVKAEISPDNISYTLLPSGDIEFCVRMCVSGGIYAEQKIKVITEVSIDEANLKQRPKDSAVVIYYADAGEELWDIARRYNSSPCEIGEINSLDGEVLTVPTTLLIPIK